MGSGLFKANGDLGFSQVHAGSGQAESDPTQLNHLAQLDIQTTPILPLPNHPDSAQIKIGSNPNQINSIH